MAEPKAKTLQQKLGFFDEDLKKPLHDDILKWVDRNAEQIIYSIYPNLKNWSEGKIEELKRFSELCIETTKRTLVTQIEEKDKSIELSHKEINSYKDNLALNDVYVKKRLEVEEIKVIALSKELEELKLRLTNLDSYALNHELPPREAIKIIEKPWEHPVTTQSTSTTGYVSSKNIVGFIDIKISFQYTQLTLTGIDLETKMVTDPIKWSQTTNKIDYKYGCEDGRNSHSVYLEIKTKITSLGELFRQLKMYQEYVKGDFVIVCPDDSERKIIEEQGYKFIKFEQ